MFQSKLAAVNETLPDNVGQPTLGPQSSILGEVLIVGLTADSTSMTDLRTLADWTVRPRLMSTGGVSQVAVLGGDIKEYQILLHPGRMNHYGVTLAEVMAATDQMNRNTNGGVIYEYGNEYIVRGVVSTEDVKEMGNTVVKTVNGDAITLADVADVQTGPQVPKLGTASEKGKPAVLLTVTKQPDTGTIELTERLEAALKDLKKNMPADVHVSTDIFRQSRFIESSINNVKQSLYEGAIFVVIVLFLFLANVRTTVISLITLPVSLLISLIVLHYFHMSVNTMSLGGLAIAIGSLVDDAIVDVENVWKHLREKQSIAKGTTASGAESCIQRITRSANAYPQLNSNNHRKLYPAVLSKRNGRTHAHTSRRGIYRGTSGINNRCTHAHACTVQLSARPRYQRGHAKRSIRNSMAQEAL